MFIVFLILAVFQNYGASMPIFIDIREELLSGPVMPNQKIRTRFDIVWSCVSTLFICTWVAIHPNIPPRGEGHIQSLWRRIKLMLWTLLMPELILIWAYRQWAAARYIAEYFQDEGWTSIHGHFLIMGGFVYVDEEGEKVLSFWKFQKLLGLPFRENEWQTVRPAKPPQIAFPTITAAEICDKARGDFLSKTIVILQCLWFIIQCIARRKEGLALTELELVTVALASLNGVMYFFWWDKPLGVNEPVKLYRDGHERPKKFIGEEGSKDDRRRQRIRNSKCSLVQRLIDIICPIHSLLKDSFLSCCACIYRQLSSISAPDVNEFLNNQRNKLDNSIPGVNYLWFLYLPIYWFLWIPFKALAIALLAIVKTEDFDTHSYVPMFYAPAPSLNSPALFFFVLPTTAIIFGALHCIAWNFHFPSDVEQLLWRIGSLAITLLPTLLPLFRALKYIDGVIKKLCQISISGLDVFLFTSVFFAGASLFAYMAARLLLLTLAVILLRRQPESAFYAINWANFLPHI